MLKVHVKYHLKPGTQADFLAGVTEKTLQDAVLNEDGCLKYEYTPAEGVPDLVLLEEEWTSLQAQQTHLKQPHMARIAELKDQYMDHMDLDMEEALAMTKVFDMERYRVLEATTTGAGD